MIIVQPWHVPVRLGAAFIMVASSLLCAAQENPVAWWPFDEGQGLAAGDISGNANDADVWEARWARGAFGTALHFDGEDSWLAAPVPAGLDGSDEMTVSAWVYWEGTGRYPNIITGGQWSPGGFLIFVADRTCSFRMGRPGHIAGDPGSQWREVSASLVPNIELGRWYHLAATFKRPQITTYVNGEQVGSAQWDYPVGCSGEVLIGRWSGPQPCHRGLIDDVRIYARALSAEEIAQMYRSTSAGRIAAGGEQAPYEILPEPELPPVARFATRDFALQIDEHGRVTRLAETAGGRELLARPEPIARAWTADGRELRRLRCSYQRGRLRLAFGRDEAQAVIGVEERGDWLAFEVREVEGDLDRLVFLQLTVQPMPLRSPMSGHVTDGEVGVCLRALTIDTQVTLGGDPPRLSAIASRRYGLMGARAGLVAGPENRMLLALQAMARGEDVPRSKLGGPWAREAKENLGSYLFARVSEQNIDEWIALARRGGFTHLHFSSWWQSLGHYKPNPTLFPNGIEGLKECVRRVHEAGLKAGMHTLTGCISTTDPWVTPVPDPRLAADATYTLARAMDERSDAVYTVERPGRHDSVWNYSSAGNVIRIGDELIQYSAISYEEPYGFLGCKRGAFGTRASAHPEGARVDHLLHRYLAFYPDESSTLVDEVAEQIARVYNECGFDQIYQDGSEGMGGWHPMAVMRTAIFQRLERTPIVEASAWGHWSWWFHSRVGAWDHSKWGFRTSMDMHCADLPTYRQAALLQAQLGWWAVNGPGRDYRAEMPDEMEYFCAKVLGNQAPMSLQGIGRPDRPANARMLEYLTMTGWYERLRLAGYFNENVLRRLRRPGEDYDLRQAPDGQWEFVPRRYSSHVVTGLDDGSERWLVTNTWADQPARLRLTALFGVAPYDSEQARVVADAADLDAFEVHADAPGVTHTLAAAEATTPDGEAALELSATNNGDERLGAWTRAGRRYQPHFDMGPCDAIGLWVRGDGKGELLNIQLVTPPQYGLTYADNYVTIDFEGWRYVELVLRERNPATWAKHRWPYRAGHALLRRPLTRNHVSELNLYLNNLPSGETATVALGPIHALPTSSIGLQDLRLTIGDRSVVLPVALYSGDYVEVDPDGAWRHYDARCELLEQGRGDAPMPMLANGLNRVSLSCATMGGGPGRVEVTVISEGAPVRGMAPLDQIDWAQMRYEYVMPTIVTAYDGNQNTWDVVCRPDARARLGAEIRVRSGGSIEAYDSPDALTLESFDDLSFFADSPDNQFARYVYDGEHRGIATKPGVTQQFEPSTDVVKVGAASARYSAASTRDDNGGWSARGRRFAQPLDLTAYRGLGVWVHGDGKLELIKFQLRDTEGGWCDMVRVVDFVGWRYLQFEFTGANIDLSRVEYLIIYYNSIPAHTTVTTYVDDIRALPRGGGVMNPSLRIGDARVVFPVSLHTGDLIRWDGGRDFIVRRAETGEVETQAVEGALPMLEPGVTRVVFEVDEAGERPYIEVGLVKDYGE